MICDRGRGRSGASIETTLELWASSPRDVKRRMRPLFTQARVALSADSVLHGLLGEERRKTGLDAAELARRYAVLGGNRPFWVAAAGTLMCCVTSCAIKRLNRA